MCVSLCKPALRGSADKKVYFIAKLPLRQNIPHGSLKCNISVQILFGATLILPYWNLEWVIKLSSPSRSICPWTSHPPWTEVSSDGSRSLGRHWIWPAAGVERTVLWFTLPALESHKLLQQVSGVKSNAVTSTKRTYLNYTDRVLCCCALGKTTLGSTQFSSSPAQYSQHRHGLTLGISLFPARPMLQRSMLPWSFSIDNSFRTLKWLFVLEMFFFWEEPAGLKDIVVVIHF